MNIVKFISREVRIQIFLALVIESHFHNWEPFVVPLQLWGVLDEGAAVHDRVEGGHLALQPEGAGVKALL